MCPYPNYVADVEDRTVEQATGELNAGPLCGLQLPIRRLSTASCKYELSTSVLHLLFRAEQALRALFETEIEMAAMTIRQFELLSALSTVERASQVELVRSTGIDRSSMTLLIERMLERKYIHRRRSRRDVRRNVISITKEGESVLQLGAAAAARAEARFLDQLPISSRVEFLNELRVIWQSSDVSAQEKYD